MPARTPPGEPRLGRLVRRLTESAEQEAARRERFAGALGALLAAPADLDLTALLAAVAGGAPAIDAAGVLEHGAGGYTVRSATGLVPSTGRLDPERARTGLLADAARTRLPQQASLAEPLPPFPAGTRAALALPLLDGRGELLGLAVFGSRSAAELSGEALLLARAAAERASRALERARLEAALAQAEAAERRAAGFRDQVFAIVGHDLRNPLGAVVMSAALLAKKGDLEGWQARTVDRCRASALRMGRIIDDLLSYTRTRLGGGIPISRAPADLGEVVRRMVDELAAAHPGIRVEVEARGDLAGSWDAARLEQVVSNLVSNAMDHGEEGAPVRVVAQGGDDAVRLEVVNRGEMPPALLEHAFEAFQRGPEATGRKASGLGLGLYIAREIVRRHGGDIAVAAEGGETRVDVRLPRGLPAEDGYPGEGRSTGG